MLDAELRERPPDLRRPLLVDLAAGLRRHEVMAPPVGVEAAEQTLRLDRLLEPPEARVRAFLLHQKGRIDLARGIVHARHQVQLSVQRRKPAEGRGVLEHQHAGKRPPGPPPAVHPAALRRLHQTRPLKLKLGPGVAVGEAMIAHQVLVKVLRREVSIARPVLLQQPLNLVHWRPPTRGSAAAPVDQALRPLSLVTIPKPAKVTFAHPQHLRRLQTTQPATAIPTNRLDNPSHSDLR